MGEKSVYLAHEGRVSCCKVLKGESLYLKKEIFVWNVLDTFSCVGSHMVSEAEMGESCRAGNYPVLILAATAE